MAIAATDRTTAHTTPAPEKMTPELIQIRECIKRMQVRVNAFHAHHDSLHRAAQGIRTIGDRLDSILGIAVARHGWSSDTRLAASALEATQQQLRMVLDADRTLPVEKERACLNHALARASEALEILHLER
jgi:hypothetical protein